MKRRVGLILLCAAVLFAGRNAVRQVRVLNDPSRRRDFDRTVARNVTPLEAELPRTAVVRFPKGHERHELLAQLRFQLVPRRVVVEGEAGFEVVERNRFYMDAVSRRAGESSAPVRQLLGEIDEEFVLCRAVR